MAQTSTEIQKRSDEKRGVAAKSYKLPKETIELSPKYRNKRGNLNLS